MRLLLVEDELDVRQFFLRALARFWPGIEVVPAADGREALDRFLREPFDLVLSDQRMPQMSGIDLLRAVRSCSPVPFLLISADRGVEQEALAAGVNDFLPKPIDLETLRRTVARYLRRS